MEDLDEIIKKEQHIDNFIKKEHISDISFQSPSDFSVSIILSEKLLLGQNFCKQNLKKNVPQKP